MSDAFYTLVKSVCYVPFIMTRRPVVSGLEYLNGVQGRCIVAANHTAPYDVPILISHTKRRVDFVSIVEVCRRPVVGTFYKCMNVMPLDRSKTDTGTVMNIIRRLESDRMVGMFPEGRFRHGKESVLEEGRIRPGLGRIAIKTQSPVIPAVIVDSLKYSHPLAWAPLRRIRYGAMFGAPMLPPQPEEVEDIKQAAKTFEDAYVERMRNMYAELKTMMA